MSANYLLEIPQCEHIMDTGFRCGSPALKGKPFCYHHNDVHAKRLKLGNKGYKFRPLESSQSITMQVAEIAQAAHDGTIKLELARLLLYSVQLVSPHVSRCGGWSGNMETELTPAMAALRNDPCRADTPVREIRVDTTTADACHPERGCTAEPKDPIPAQIGNTASTLSGHQPPANACVTPSINNNQSPITNSDKKRPRYYDPEGCLSFLTKVDQK